jgi:LPPG:FO 2-phospho-L-lactate transferase
MMQESNPCRIVVLSGGVGGAKFAAGLNDILPAGELAVIVNTADDFDHLGLRICPDLDSVMYALADIQDDTRGWGRREESWNCLKSLTSIGAEDWFALGDHDLAVHLFRTDCLRKGLSLGDVTATLAIRLGIKSKIIPMTESIVSTVLSTEEGELQFQDYFVRRQCVPKVLGIRYAQEANTALHPKAESILLSSNLRAIFIAPSNPFLSIDPILSMPEMKDRLEKRTVPVIAISPLINGKSLKGPLTDMLDSLGLAPSNSTIAQHYEGLIDGLVIDTSDALDAPHIQLPTHTTSTLMTNAISRQTVAREALGFLEELASA